MTTATIPYNERKAHRIDKASQHAQRLPVVFYNDTRIEVRKANRSKGYQSDYEPVLTYWVLIYKDGRLYTGFSCTPSSYRSQKADVLAKTGVILPE